MLVCAGRAAASPGLSLELGGNGGIGHAHLAGWYRDDEAIVLRTGLAISDFTVLDLGWSEDVDRVEPAFRLGARVRLWEGSCWRERWSPYVRGELAVVGATHVGSNYDLLAGIGHRGSFTRNLAWYAEVDAIARVGEVETLSFHVELGVAIATASFWR